MCLAIVAWKVHPKYRLIVAANRDEFHARPSQPLKWWPDRPGLLGGRDLLAGGTWLAAHKCGRFATVTNYREYQSKQAGLKSRGEIVTEFVVSNKNTMSFVKAIRGDHYMGFNLLASDGDSLCYVSNRSDGPLKLDPGIYGLSNAALDTPWSKVVQCRNGLQRLISADNVNETALVRLLSDRKMDPAENVQSNELPFEVARRLTAPFIVSPKYGTRCTTALTWTYAREMLLCEHRFDLSGKKTGKSRFRFETSTNQAAG
jgi:uncharacterized protein with NRDE domain